MTPRDEAGAYCQRLRENRNWRLVESAPVMGECLEMAAEKGVRFPTDH